MKPLLLPARRYAPGNRARGAWLPGSEGIRQIMEMTSDDLERPPMNNDGRLNDVPLVSVVIATYNRADYVGETIESVVQQTYKNIEIIVIDDGSTDDTATVVEKFAPNVRYIFQQNSERGAARNHGLRLANGELIAFLDSDDLWLPTKVEQEVRFLGANPGVGLVYSDAGQIDSAGNELRLRRAAGSSGRVTGRLLHENFVSIGTHLVRTNLVRDISGFREERQLSGAEDWEMWVRLSLHAEFAHLPVVTAKIRTHPGNTMSDAAAMRRSTARAAELFRQSQPLVSAYAQDLRRMDANIALVNAINFCSQNDLTQSIDFLRSAFSADPRIIFDPRFAYTVARVLKKAVGL